jgi:hypothetical protein
MPKISELPAATALTGSEIIPVVQSSETRHATMAQVFESLAGETSVSGTVSSSGWYRFAQSTVANRRSAGTFLITWEGAGFAGSAVLIAAASGSGNVDMTLSTYARGHSSGVISFRCLGKAGEDSYLELNVTPGGTTVIAKQMVGDWDLVPLTGGTVPSGYTAKTLSPSSTGNGILTTGNVVALGHGIAAYPTASSHLTTRQFVEEQIAAAGGGDLSLINLSTTPYQIVSAERGTVFILPAGGSNTEIVLPDRFSVPAGWYVRIINACDSAGAWLKVKTYNNQPVLFANGTGATEYQLNPGETADFVMSHDLFWLVLDDVLRASNRIPTGFTTPTATGQRALASGSGATASNTGANVAGGEANAASGAYAAVGGGYQNTASASAATVAGGQSNVASGPYSVIGGGTAHTASGWFASIAGGTSHQATHNYTSMGGGARGKTRMYGVSVHANGTYTVSERGSAQSESVILRAETTDATAGTLTSDGTAAVVTASQENVFIPPAGSAVFFTLDVVAVRQGSETEFAAWRLEGVLGRGPSLAAALITNDKAVLAQPSGTEAWDVTLTVDPTNGYLKPSVQGESAKTIRWVGRLRTVEATF